MNLFEMKKGKKPSIIDFVNNKFMANRANMNMMYRSWMLNLAWIRGYQNVDYDYVNKTFIKNKRDPWRPRLISNLMLPLVRKLIANLTYIHPIWDVIPATSDEEDIQISNVSTKIARYIWEHTDMSLKLVRLLGWQCACGNAFFKVGWDATVGDEIEIEAKHLEQELLQQVMEMMGIGQTPEKIKVNEGDVFIEPISPFNVIFDDVSVVQDSDWIIESNIRSLDWVTEKFGNKYKGLPQTDEHSILIFPAIYNDNQKPSGSRKGVLVHELFIKRKSKMFPKGLHAIIAGGEHVITPQDNPFEHGQIPYSHFLEIYDPSSLWGTSIAEQVRPNQAEYNKIRSGVIEQVNMMSQLQWLNPKQSEVTEFTNKPGQVYNYKYPYKPEQQQPKPLPAYIERSLDRIRMDIQDTASSHDVSEGKNAPGVRAGKTVLALQDADDSVIGPVLLWFDDRLSYTGRLALQTFSQFTTAEKVLNITGDFNQLETINFIGSMVKGKNKGDYFNVRVKTYGRQMMSRSGRESLASMLIQNQVLNPVTDKEKILRILGTADLISVYDENAADVTRQYKEIEDMITGQPVPVTLGQNHVVHKDTIKKYISSSKWDKLQPEQKQIVIQHLQAHMQQEVQEAVFPQLYSSQLIAMTQPQPPPTTGGSSGGSKQ